MTCRLFVIAVLVWLTGCSMHIVIRDLSPCTDQPGCVVAFRETVESFWVPPTCATAGMRTTVAVSWAAETGPFAVRIVRSSGYQEFDASWLSAVREASPHLRTRAVPDWFMAAGEREYLAEFVSRAPAQQSAPACTPSYVHRAEFPAVLARR